MKKILTFLFTIGIIAFGTSAEKIDEYYKNNVERIPGLILKDDNTKTISIYFNNLKNYMKKENIAYSKRDKLAYEIYQNIEQYAKNNGYKLDHYNKKDRFNPNIKKNTKIEKLRTTIYEYNSMEGEIFTNAFINITKDEFKNWTKENFDALEELLEANKVESIEKISEKPKQFHWFTIKFEDGTGISFEYNSYKVVTYGVLDDGGSMVDYGTLGYMKRTTDGYDFYKIENWGKGNKTVPNKFE